MCPDITCADAPVSSGCLECRGNGLTGAKRREWRDGMIVNMAVMDWIIPPFTTFGTGFMFFFPDVSRMIISCKKSRQEKWVVFRRPSPDGCLRMGRSDTRSPGIGTRYVSASCCGSFRHDGTIQIAWEWRIFHMQQTPFSHAQMQTTCKC